MSDKPAIPPEGTPPNGVPQNDGSAAAGAVTHPIATPVKPTPQPHANGAQPPKSWWHDNWDKVLGILLSLIVGGVAGFFAAILGMQKELHDISTRVNTLETRASAAWEPKIDKIDPLDQKLQDIERLINELERSDEAEALLRERIQSIVEDTRKRTAEELRAILKENP